MLCGPWEADLDWAERVARLRCLRTLVHMLAHGHPLADRLAEAETDDDAFRSAGERLERDLPSLTRRRIWATYAALHRPQPGAR